MKRIDVGHIINEAGEYFFKKNANVGRNLTIN